MKRVVWIIMGLVPLVCVFGYRAAQEPYKVNENRGTRTIYECKKCHKNYYNGYPGLCRAIDPSTGEECLSTDFRVAVVRLN